VNELIAKLEREKAEFLHRIAETLTKEFERPCPRTEGKAK